MTGWAGGRATSDGTWEFLLCASLKSPTYQVFIYSHDVSYSQRLPKGPLLSTCNCALDLEQSATLAALGAFARPGLITRSASSLCVEIELVALSVFLVWAAVSLPSSKHHNLFPPASATRPSCRTDGPISMVHNDAERLSRRCKQACDIPVLRSSLPISVDSQLEGDPH